MPPFNVRAIGRHPRLRAVPVADALKIRGEAPLALKTFLDGLRDDIWHELLTMRRSIDIFGSSGHSLLKTFTDNDATPTVGVPDPTMEWTFLCSHSLATNVTDFDDAMDGQRITVIFTTANATLVHAAGVLRLSGTFNYNPPANTVMSFVSDATTWYERSRVNT